MSWRKHMVRIHGWSAEASCTHAYDFIALVSDPRLLDHLDQLGKYCGEVVFAVDILTCLPGYLGQAVHVIASQIHTNLTRRKGMCVALEGMERMLAMAYVWKAALGYSQSHLSDLVAELVCSEPQ